MPVLKGFFGFFPDTSSNIFLISFVLVGTHNKFELLSCFMLDCRRSMTLPAAPISFKDVMLTQGAPCHMPIIYNG